MKIEINDYRGIFKGFIVENFTPQELRDILVNGAGSVINKEMAFQIAEKFPDCISAEIEKYSSEFKKYLSEAYSRGLSANEARVFFVMEEIARQVILILLDM